MDDDGDHDADDLQAITDVILVATGQVPGKDYDFNNDNNISTFDTSLYSQCLLYGIKSSCPSPLEVCGDGVDNDCDTSTDEVTCADMGECGTRHGTTIYDSDGGGDSLTSSDPNLCANGSDQSFTYNGSPDYTWTWECEEDTNEAVSCSATETSCGDSIVQ